MRSVRASTSSARTDQPVVAAIGIFDGVHRGHQAILRKAAQRARRLDGRAVAVTFDPHPLAVLHPPGVPRMLLSLEDRLRTFASLGIRSARVLPFTRSFSRWSPERFSEKILEEKLKAREVVVGHDFRFGAGRAGTPATLQELGRRHGFRTWVVPPLKVGQERVSSRRIRELIAGGDLRRAARFLGRPVSVRGRVVRGAGRGGALGFATANLRLESGLLPPVGVYAVDTLLGRRCYAGMANIGYRPTFQRAEKSPLLEVHLFGVKQPLYGKDLTVRFLQPLREERKFPSPGALRRQLERDARRAKRVFALHGRKRMV